MGFGKTYRSISRNDIKYTDFEILNHYLNITEIPCIICAPYRIDRSPSVSLFSIDGDSIYFKDFGSTYYGGALELLRLVWNLQSINDVLEIINTTSMSKLDKQRIEPQKLVKGHYKSPAETSIQVKVRDWKQWDFEFWGQYGLNRAWLEFGDVYPIDWIIFNRKNKTSSFPADKYAYVYIEFKDNQTTLKVYQPYSSEFKWLSQHDSSVWDLWDKLPDTGETLIITKSRKDALTIWANTGIPSTSLQSEAQIPKTHVVNQLKERFKNIYLLYDNDFDKPENYGRIYGNKLSKIFNLPQLEIPEEYQSKDASDFCKNHGSIELNKLITNLIKNYNNGNTTF